MISYLYSDLIWEVQGVCSVVETVYCVFGELVMFRNFFS